MHAKTAKTTGRYALIYAGAIAAGSLASLAQVPLPWMIGPLLFASAAGMAGMAVRVPAITRPVGQTVIAGSVGLAFTPAAFVAVSEQFFAMILVTVLTVAAGFLVAAVLMRLARVDVVSASLASVPIGPVETAHMAEKYNVAPGPVVFAQTLRIMLLILIIPPVIIALDGTVDDPGAVLSSMSVEPSGAVLLIALATTGGALFRKLGIANPFFLGPLAFSAAAAALSLPVSAVPYVILAAAQVLLGVWLGAMFDRELLRNAGGFVIAALVSTILMIALCCAMALGVSAMTGIRWTTMILATAPGSVTEMALTAKILQEGVAMVTAFHLVRIFIILPAAPLIFSVTARLASRYPTVPPPRSDEKEGG
jgi:uncharacterized protein